MPMSLQIYYSSQRYRWTLFPSHGFNEILGFVLKPPSHPYFLSCSAGKDLLPSNHAYSLSSANIMFRTEVV